MDRWPYMSNHVLVRVVLLLLVRFANHAWGNNTVSRDFRSQNATGPNIAAIVAPTVTLGLLAIIALAVAGWLLCVVKKKRQTEGAYRPSAEEQCGTRSVATTDILKLPKEERLI
ncbi:protein crumbs homolog 3a isoform X1 [Hippocampus comes]|uniref:Crumbs cell polarity complex component 3 n=1 Tax=Hippocampus comes TaxID=109280 RepID=A0A3Q3DI01_HIPCM|nr:PREDICTED: protein crumbs homolog 3 isoform X1 [Hippocampus comes]XP_019734827.1 PREDICTED: protein crumbs homolog 3 isoform X1 [Hippocampus comes]XP_019734828.1 PREDICTED: protein crumbs homolog 3 isoform X1 [Hippocampus comes]